ncbi:MAG: ABC transporter ATP-binding protein [Pseudomonadota bacterium]
MSEADQDVAIRISGLSKRYEIYDSPRHRLWQGMAMGKRQFFREFWALRDVNLTIKRGETFGIVGRNGAGKSTLLQLISGVLTPTAGSITTNGRITALLELGAGLNPEFSGLENIRMSAAVLGMSDAELAKKMDVIIEFAALGDFINQPVKHYSSGMIMRLAFAVAINFDPDILIVDEALAVGDELFQLKCIRRIQEIKESGATILFVSHSTHTINQICDRAVLIDGGKAVQVGNAKSVSERYNKLLFSLDTGASPADVDVVNDHAVAAIGASEIGAASGELLRSRDIGAESRPQGQIVDVGIMGHDYRNLAFEQGDTARFRMRVRFAADTPNVIMGMMITTATGVDCYHTNLLCRDLMIEHAAAGEVYSVNFEVPLALNAGSYIVVFDCQYDMRATPKLVDIFYEALKFTVVPDRLIDDGGIAALGAKIECQLVK